MRLRIKNTATMTREEVQRVVDYKVRQGVSYGRACKELKVGEAAFNRHRNFYFGYDRAPRENPAKMEERRQLVERVDALARERGISVSAALRELGLSENKYYLARKVVELRGLDEQRKESDVEEQTRKELTAALEDARLTAPTPPEEKQKFIDEVLRLTRDENMSTREACQKLGQPVWRYHNYQADLRRKEYRKYKKRPIERVVEPPVRHERVEVPRHAAPASGGGLAALFATFASGNIKPEFDVQEGTSEELKLVIQGSATAIAQFMKGLL